MGYPVNGLEALPDIVLFDHRGEAVPWHWLGDFVANLALRIGDGELLELYDDAATFDEDGTSWMGRWSPGSKSSTFCHPDFSWHR
jgi:hypothetical protein